MLFGGHLTIFGLSSYGLQISIVESCRLRRVGNLPRNFERGTCNTFKTNDGMEETLLCFGFRGPKLCQRWLRINKISFQPKFSYNGNSISSAPSSNYDHLDTSLGQFDNRPMVVGNQGSPASDGHKKVEQKRNQGWQTLDDFPFVNDDINSYSMVNFNRDLYLFGMFLFNQKFSTYYSF